MFSYRFNFRFCNEKNASHSSLPEQNVKGPVFLHVLGFQKQKTGTNAFSQHFVRHIFRVEVQQTNAMIKKMPVLAAFVVGSLTTALLISQLAFRQPIRLKNDNETENKWFAPQIPAELSFAGEPVPLNRWDVREKFDKEFLYNYYNQGTILYLLKLANRNFPIISERLQANGVPDDFKYLCIAESNMQSWAKSSAGAVGYWQFLKGTAAGYGLEVNAMVDERKNLEKATDAACRYFKQAYSKFGNWTAAAASYNCGQGGYNAQAAFQQTKNYYKLQLPEETNKYVFRILTFKYLMEHAEELGFIIEPEQKYQAIPVRTMVVSTSIANLAQFAIKEGTTYKMLRNLNPWLTGRNLTVAKGRKYYMKLPAQE